MRLFAIFVVLALMLRAQAPQKIEQACSAQDVEFFGLTCSEDDPCPVFLELAAVEPNGASLFLTGNLHTVNTTLGALLLKSDDGGKTWTEPMKRIRAAALEQIQFADFQHGWIGGVKLEPLPRDPFLLTTTDGGTTWRPLPLFEETQSGSILQFWFDSANSGQLILDTSQRQSKRYELYETKTGGVSWERREVMNHETPLAQARPREYASWRIRSDPKAYRVERKTEFRSEANAAENWETVASFAIQAVIAGERFETPMKAIELELFRHLLVSIAEEMGVVLRRTSYSANIKERRDYSCAVYDASGETVAMGDHMPVHLGAMPLSVRAVRETFELGPGDVALVNDPFRGGTHLPDITAVSAVFMGGSRRASFFVANRAHHADVGGMSPGSMPLAKEIFQEGIRIPPVLIQSAGKIDRPLLDLLLANVRTPVEREGDLLAQLASLERGVMRLHELVAKYGGRRVAGNMRALQDYSERMMRAAIGKLPRGVYRFEDCLDNDGMTRSPVWVRVAITIDGDSARVDFSGSDAQVQGPMNANYAVTLAAVMYVFRCLIKEEVPFTAGILRPIEVMAPGGSVVNALAPAAMAAGNVEMSQRVTDVVLGALAQAAPDLIPAASSGTMNNLSFGGWDPGRKSAFAYYETIAGGMGASPAGDGYSATHTHMTNTLNTPVEAFEHQFPVRVEGYRVRRGSGGRGAHRGGDGIVRELRFLTPAEVTILSDRRERGPWGLSGGEAGKPGRNTLVRAGREQRIAAKVRLDMRAGDMLRIETPGGGGWGGPQGH